MTAIRKDAEKTPLSHIIIITLIAVGGVAIPLKYLTDLFISDALTSRLLAQTLIRVILSVIALVFLFKYGYQKAFIGRCGAVGLLMVLPALLVAVNNIPLIALFTGNVHITASAGNIVLHVFYCLVIGFYEEIVFRGMVMPLALKKFEKIKFGVFWAVAFSSAIFALSHLIALIDGANVGAVFLQVGYSFLIGAMCGISVLVTKNLFVAIALHAVYNFGGLMVGTIAVGNQWDLITIIITAVLGVIVFIYMLLVLLKVDYNKVKPLYYPNGFGETEEEKERDKI